MKVTVGYLKRLTKQINVNLLYSHNNTAFIISNNNFITLKIKRTCQHILSYIRSYSNNLTVYSGSYLEEIIFRRL